MAWERNLQGFEDPALRGVRGRRQGQRKVLFKGIVQQAELPQFAKGVLQRYRVGIFIGGAEGG